MELLKNKPTCILLFIFSAVLCTRGTPYCGDSGVQPHQNFVTLCLFWCPVTPPCSGWPYTCWQDWHCGTPEQERAASAWYPRCASGEGTSALQSNGSQVFLYVSSFYRCLGMNQELKQNAFLCVSSWDVNELVINPVSKEPEFHLP